MKELPIACSLQPGELAARQSELAWAGSRGLLSVDRPDERHAVLRFENDPETGVALERIVAAEGECCPFLSLKVSEGDAIQLEIDGPAEAGPIIDQLIEAFEASPA
jgi:hypothetical protein